MSTTLPIAIRTVAEGVVGPIAAVVDRSWPRENSAVWQVTTAAGDRFFVKQHPTALFHQREVAAYQRLVPSLGPGRAPELLADDQDMRIVVLSSLPGEVVKGCALSANEVCEVYRQAGRLLRRVHDLPARGVWGFEQLVVRQEEHLRRAAGLLSTREIGLVRESAAALSRLGRRLAMTVIHGDFQPRNLIWDRPTHRLALIDFERAEDGPAVQDLVRLEFGPWYARPDLREAFYTGYGRHLTSEEGHALRCLAALDALGGLQWGTTHGDTDIIHQAHATFANLT